MRHLDEARETAVAALTALVSTDQRIQRMVLIDDLFGLLRVVVWVSAADSDSVRTSINRLLHDEGNLGPYWTGDVWVSSNASAADTVVYDAAWNTAQVVPGTETLRIADRHRSRVSWFAEPVDSPWPVPEAAAKDAPPIVVFYSFKGGVGRSTSVAAFALQRARQGERVVVVDFDLDAPGVGSLLAADSAGTTAAWGVIDYLLERPHGPVDLADYYHACRRQELTGSGEVLVFPTGRLDALYLQKLSRVDLERRVDALESHPTGLLLEQIRQELKPDWILIDSRTGFSESAGMLLGGLGHLHVLFGTSSEQSWTGLEVVIQRLGVMRVRANRPQAECILVQALVPRETAIASVAKAIFEDRAREEFLRNYYVEDPAAADDEDLWYVRDAEGEDAPHATLPLSYDSRLAHFRFVDEVADDLTQSPEYLNLGRRIFERFFPDESE